MSCILDQVDELILFSTFLRALLEHQAWIVSICVFLVEVCVVLWSMFSGLSDKQEVYM